MAQQQVNVSIDSVGFNGLNTEDSPITQDYSFAAVADNAVIDQYGRIGARKAFDNDTTNFPTLATIPGATTHVLELDVIENGNINGSPSIICTGRNVGYDAGGVYVDQDYYIFKRDGGTLTSISYPAMSDDSALQTCQIVPTDDRYYILAEGNEVMIWDGTAITLISAEAGYYGIQNIPAGAQVPPEFNTGLAAYGRIWGVGHNSEQNVIYYSDLLVGASNYTVDGLDPLSTAGKINVLESWPNGRDEIIGLAAHNNRLIVFGRQNILVYNSGYGDPADPASGFTLEDTISNVGCVSRDAIVNIGSDVIFVDDSGVRSLGRTIQERSSPMGNLTNKVRGDITRLIAQTIDNASIKIVYDASQSFVIALFTEQELAYCLDMKSYLTGGLAKITRWTDCYYRDMAFVEGATVPVLLFTGKNDLGIIKYNGYSGATGDDYIFKYYSNQLNFGEPTKTKFIKQIDYTIISSLLTGDAFAKWGYNTVSTFKSKHLTLLANPASYWGEAEYNVGLYGESDLFIKRYRVNTSGSGESVKIGLEVTINGNGVSLQEIDVQTLIGRII